MEQKIIEIIEKRCKEIKLTNKRLRKDRLLLIGYVYGLMDTVNILKKNSA